MAGLTCYADRHCSIIRLLKKAGSATDREALSAGGMSVSVTSQARCASRGRMCYAISRRTVMNHVSQAIQKGRPARPQRASKDSSSNLARVPYPRDGPDECTTARVRQGSLASFFSTVRPSRPRELPDCPSLRASNEHSFIVRVLRARRTVWRLPS